MHSWQPVKKQNPIFFFFFSHFFFLVIIVKLSKSNSATKNIQSDSSREAKFRRTVFSILFVAIPVALTFAVIFIFAVLEVATHRHAERTGKRKKRAGKK